MTPDPTQHDVLLNIKAVSAMLSRSKASIYRDIAANRFPRQVKIGGSSRWRQSEILAFIASISVD